MEGKRRSLGAERGEERRTHLTAAGNAGVIDELEAVAGRVGHAELNRGGCERARVEERLEPRGGAGREVVEEHTRRRRRAELRLSVELCW